MPGPIDDEVLVEPLGSDLVALAQCHALDASVFPHPSLPAVLGGAPNVLVARATAGGPAVGFVATRAGRGVLEIHDLAVAAEQRGRGIGRALLRAAVASARRRGFRAVLLHVSTGNGAALELYTSEGFRAARRLRRFYSSPRFADGGDAWEMVLRLA